MLLRQIGINVVAAQALGTHKLSQSGQVSRIGTATDLAGSMSNIQQAASPEKAAPSDRDSVEDSASTSADRGGTAKRLACHVCRERKVRCDRKQPQCGRCTRLGHNCKYNLPAKQQLNQMDVSRLLLTLHTRLGK